MFLRFSLICLPCITRWYVQMTVIQHQVFSAYQGCKKNICSPSLGRTGPAIICYTGSLHSTGSKTRTAHKSVCQVSAKSALRKVTGMSLFMMETHKIKNIKSQITYLSIFYLLSNNHTTSALFKCVTDLPRPLQALH